MPTLGIPPSLRGVVDLCDASDDWIPIDDKSRGPGFYVPTSRVELFASYGE